MYEGNDLIGKVAMLLDHPFSTIDLGRPVGLEGLRHRAACQYSERTIQVFVTTEASTPPADGVFEREPCLGFILLNSIQCSLRLDERALRVE